MECHPALVAGSPYTVQSSIEKVLAPAGIFFVRVILNAVKDPVNFLFYRIKILFFRF